MALMTTTMLILSRALTSSGCVFARQGPLVSRRAWSSSGAAHDADAAPEQRDDARGRSQGKLPRSRSVHEERLPGPGPARSVDAPPDPAQRVHRDTRGLTDEEVQAQVDDAIANAGQRAGEVLRGRTEELRENPSLHQPQVDRGSKSGNRFDDWTGAVLGDGVSEGIKHGRDKARDALRGMFNPVGGGGASGISQRPTKGSDAGGAGGNTTADGNTSRAGPVREASSG